MVFEDENRLESLLVPAKYDFSIIVRRTVSGFGTPKRNSGTPHCPSMR